MEGFRTMLKPALEKIPDKLERLAIVNDLSSYLGVDAKAILEQLNVTAAAPKQKQMTASLTLTDSESTLIRGLLSNPAVFPEIDARLKQLSFWRNLKGNKILSAILDGSTNMNELDARLDDTNRRLLASVMFADKTDGEVSPEQLSACVERLEAEERAQQVASIRDEIRRLEREGKYAEAIAKQRELPATGRIVR